MDRTLKALLVWAECEAEEGEQLRLALDGYKVVRARDYQEACDRLASSRPDLVFVDGDDADTAGRLATLVASDRRLASIPVLLVQPRAHDVYGEQPFHPALALAYPAESRPLAGSPADVVGTEQAVA